MGSKRRFSSSFSAEESWCLRAAVAGTYTWKKSKQNCPPLAPACVAFCFLFSFSLAFKWTMIEMAMGLLCCVRKKTEVSVMCQRMELYDAWSGSLCACLYVCTTRINLHAVAQSLGNLHWLLICSYYFHPGQVGITCKRRRTGVLRLPSL